MTQFTAQNIVDRARIYVDDNNKVTDGWKRPEDWLAMLKPEIRACYRKWVRENIISYEYVDATFTGPKYAFLHPGPVTTVSMPLAIIGVAQNMGNCYRVLAPASSQLGRGHIWDNPSGPTSVATTWTASWSILPNDLEDNRVPENFPVGDTGFFAVSLHPPDTASNYVVRYIHDPFFGSGAIFDSNYRLDLPDGFEDYVAMRLARKALASEGASSQALERLILQAEADQRMEGLGNQIGDAPKVRRVQSFGRRLYNTSWEVSPQRWYYPV